MKIVCADSVTRGAEAFSTLGEVVCCPEHEITRALLMDADLLAARSKTVLNAALLKGTRVRYAGTATAGIDHADLAFLDDAGIRFASAPGCNANSVGEYLVAALLFLCEKHHFTLEGLTLGIVGHGNVGKRVQEKAEALGMQVLLNDPPLFDETGDSRYRPLEETVAGCDILTLHVPLIDDGPHPTRKLITLDLLQRMKPGGFLVNACRGEVLENGAVIRLKDSGRLKEVVLDVWDPEPAFPLAVLERAALGTAHIAGHSYEGKLNGTLMIYRQACAFLGVDASWDPYADPPVNDQVPFRLEAAGLSDEAALRQLVRGAYDIERDDALLRDAAVPAADQRSARFKQLRSAYRMRREFYATRVAMASPAPSLLDKIKALGFQPVSQPESL